MIYLFLFRVNQVHLETQAFQVDEVNQANPVSFILSSLRANLIGIFLFSSQDFLEPPVAKETTVTQVCSSHFSRHTYNTYHLNE